jgi:hypothetical protein
MLDRVKNKIICFIIVNLLLLTVVAYHANAVAASTEYSGAIHDTQTDPAHSNGNLAIKMTRYHTVRRISGTIQIDTPLEGTGSFQGFITQDSKIFFIDTTKEGSNGIIFQGSTPNSGTYVDSQGQSGTWELTQPIQANAPDGSIIKGTITNTSGQNPISAGVTFKIETVRQNSTTDGIIGHTDMTTLAGSGDFNGTITDSIVHFTVIPNDMKGTTAFTGIEKDGKLNGNYSATTGENGIWTAK